MCEGVSSEGMLLLLLLLPFEREDNILCVCVYDMFFFVCLCQSLINFWRSGRRRRTTTVRRLVTSRLRRPDNRRHSPPGNRTGHMTSFFHFECKDSNKTPLHYHTNKNTYTHTHTVPGQVSSESTHTHKILKPDTTQLLPNQSIQAVSLLFVYVTFI